MPLFAWFLLAWALVIPAVVVAAAHAFPAVVRLHTVARNGKRSPATVSHRARRCESRRRASAASPAIVPARHYLRRG
jgi:hypothetical protein